MKTKFTIIQSFILVSFMLLNFKAFAQNCAIPNPGSGCTAPAVFTFVSAQNGNWNNAATWVGGVAPSTENINNKQIKITHDVTVQNGNLKLDNNTVILITDGGRLTLRNGNIHLEDGNQSSTEKLLISNGFLRTSGNVQQSGSATVFCAIGASIEVGDEDARSTPGVFTEGLFNSSSSYTSANFQNTRGYRRLEDVCLNVTQDMQNDGGTDEFIRVCAEIGDAGRFSGPKNNTGGNSSFDGDDNGNFQVQSSTGTSTKIYSSEFYIPNGSLQNSRSMIICNSDFRLTNGNIQNQSSSSIVGQDIVLWINNPGNGNLQNSGTWAAASIDAWRIDHSSNPSGLAGLVAESSAADILTHFNDCVCGGDDCPTTLDTPCEKEDCCFNYVLAGSQTGAPAGFFRPAFDLTNLCGENVTSVIFTTPGATASGAGASERVWSTNAVLGSVTYSLPSAPFNGLNPTEGFFFNILETAVLAPGGNLITVTVNTSGGTYSQTFDLLTSDPLCGIVTLPVELLTFTGAPSSEGIDLKWVTASEKNNDRFEIERSADGKNFERIGEMKGKGTTSALSDYKYLDKRAIKGLNYYRLKQVDFDGSHAFSSIVKVNSEKGSTSLGVQLIPNPCSDENCSILLQGVDATKTLVVEMRDLTGRVVFRQQVASDQASFNLPKANLGKGIYLLSAKNGEYITYQKVIIQ